MDTQSLFPAPRGHANSDKEWGLAILGKDKGQTGVAQSAQRLNPRLACGGLPVWPLGG